MKTFTNILLPFGAIFSILTTATAQELHYEVEFESYFENREFSAMGEMSEHSGTDFALRLMPKLELEFDEGSSLHFGVDIIEPVGYEGDKFFESVKPLLYYGYDSSKWSISMGIFERSRMMIESYSTAFYLEDYLFYDNRVGGLQARYMHDESFVEFVCDWEGERTATTRERFRLLSSGRQYWSNLYLGYNLSITHFAGQDAENLDNVVDNILLNPCVGVRFGDNWSFDTKVSYLQSLQRDRSYGDKWLAPSMFEAAFAVEHKGFSLDERFYIGDDIMPLYGGHHLEDGTHVEYGELLYTGDPFFRAEGGYYNRAALGYCRELFDEKMEIKASFVTHLDGAGFGTQQLLELKVKLGGALYKHKTK